MKKITIPIEKEFVMKFALALEKNDVKNYGKRIDDNGKHLFTFKATVDQAYAIGFTYSEILNEEK